MEQIKGRKNKVANPKKVKPNEIIIKRKKSIRAKNKRRGFGSKNNADNRTFNSRNSNDIAYVLGSIVALRSVGEEVKLFSNIRSTTSTFYKICKARGTTNSQRNWVQITEIVRFIKKFYREQYLEAIPALPHMIARNAKAEANQIAREAAADAEAKSSQAVERLEDEEQAQRLQQRLRQEGVEAQRNEKEWHDEDMGQLGGIDTMDTTDEMACKQNIDINSLVQQYKRADTNLDLYSHRSHDKGKQSATHCENLIEEINNIQSSNWLAEQRRFIEQCITGQSTGQPSTDQSTSSGQLSYIPRNSRPDSIDRKKSAPDSESDSD